MTTDTERRFDESWQELEDEPTFPGSASPARQGTTIDNLLPFVPDVLDNGELATSDAQPAPTAATLRVEIPAPAVQDTGLHGAELRGVRDGKVLIRFRGERADRPALVAEEVETELLEEALRDGQHVLVMRSGSDEPLIVGVLYVRRPSTTRFSGEVLEIEASRSLTLRSGRAGVRLNADGNIEVVGSRISAASRGLMRLVGRVLRLN